MFKLLSLIAIISSSLFPAFVKSDDRFLFTTGYTCFIYGQGFRFSSQFYEKDSMFESWDDEITERWYSDGPSGKRFTVYEGYQNGDQWGSSGYTVYAVIYHDCTHDKKHVMIRLNLTPQCEIGRGICHYLIERDLTNDWGVYDHNATLKYDDLPFPQFIFG